MEPSLIYDHVLSGTGFIGAKQVRQMLARGERDVTVFDISPDLGRLSDLADDLVFVRGDLGILESARLFEVTRRCVLATWTTVTCQARCG